MSLHRLNNFLSFLYGFFSGLKLNLIGKLAGGDLIAVIYSIFTIKNWGKYYRRFPDIKRIHNSLALFLFIQVISDIYNQTNLTNCVRGLANILMCAIIIMYLSQILHKSLSSLPLIFLWFALSALIFGSDIVKNHETSINDMGFFKFRVIPFLNSMLFFLVLYFKSLNIFNITIRKTAFVFVFYGFLCFLFDARSNGMFFLISGILVLNKNLFKVINNKNFLWIFSLLAVVFQSLYYIYVSAILSGNINSNQTKSQFEKIDNPFNPIDLLFAGRVEVFGSTRAIADKPLLGHGSWAKDVGGFYTKFSAMKLNTEQENYFFYRLENEGDKNLLIPTHSILLGTWVSAGLFAFISVLCILILFIKRTFQLFQLKGFTSSLFFPIVTYYLLNIFWVFLFSPLQELKSTVPLPLVLIIILHQKFKLNFLNPKKTIIKY